MFGVLNEFFGTQKLRLKQYHCVKETDIDTGVEIMIFMNSCSRDMAEDWLINHLSCSEYYKHNSIEREDFDDEESIFKLFEIVIVKDESSIFFKKGECWKKRLRKTYTIESLEFLENIEMNTFPRLLV